MAFDVTNEFGYVESGRRDTLVGVQTVVLSDKDGSNPKPPRLELREQVNSDRYSGPGKTALVFTDPDDVEALVEVLQEALPEWRAALDDAPPEPSQKQTVEVRKPKARAAKAKAATPRKRATKKPAAK